MALTPGEKVEIIELMARMCQAYDVRTGGDLRTRSRTTGSSKAGAPIAAGVPR